MAKCSVCGGQAPFMMSMCDPCIAKDADARRTGLAQAHANQRAREERASAIIITTSHTVEDYRIGRTLDVISSECVYGMNLFRDFFASVTDLVGGRSRAAEKILREARETCLAELRQVALDIGADAVIGVDLDYNEFSGAGKSMLFLVASGTAVRLERIGAPSA